MYEVPVTRLSQAGDKAALLQGPFPYQGQVLISALQVLWDETCTLQFRHSTKTAPEEGLRHSLEVGLQKVLGSSQEALKDIVASEHHNKH